MSHNSFTTAILIVVSILFAHSDLRAWDKVGDILDTVSPPVFPDVELTITDFGAIGDGETDALPSIQEAINVANSAGGGNVILPAGVWLSNGPIHLKSNVNLVVQEDATLIFSPFPQYYLPAVLTRWEGTEVFTYSPLIYAYNAINVAVTGKGTIIGNGGEIFSTWRDKQGPAQSLLREMGAEGVPVYERVFGEDTFLRPNMIQFFSSQNILIEGVTIRDSPMWVNHLVYCTNVIMRGVTVDSHRLNNDGIVIESSSGVLIEGNNFNTGDDSIVIKAGRDQDAWRVGRPSQNIVIRDNTMRGHNGIAFGSEMSAGIRSVYITDNLLVRVRNAVYFKSNLDRGGIVENIRVCNITIEQAEYVIRFRTDYHGYRGDMHPPLFNDILIEDITCKIASETAVDARGTPDAETIRNVRIRNLTVLTSGGAVTVSGANGFILEDVIVNDIIYTGDYSDGIE
jgi:polygalacturonase